MKLLKSAVKQTNHRLVLLSLVELVREVPDAGFVISVEN